MKVIIPIMCLSLAACCPPELVKQAPNFDARLMAKCVELPEGEISTFTDVIVIKTAETKLYINCKNAHNGLVDAVIIYQKEFTK